VRALLSVHDKTAVVELAESLTGFGWELLATEGTASLLNERGIPVVDIQSWTNLPVMFGGRMKTLHHLVFAALLCRRGEPRHEADAALLSVVPIDMLACNFMPLTEQASGDPADMVDRIDVGGPAMTRAAAKNNASVIPVVDPADYGTVVSLLRESGGNPDGVDGEMRRRLAAKAFATLADLDRAVVRLLGGDGHQTASTP
jgi:phosphoribosylaminoimidazolecarboxamide formyltransferase / IMP cyclohydrolase